MATLKETYGSMEPKSLKDQYGPMLPENAANYPQIAMAQMSGKPIGFADLSVPESVKFKQRGLDAGRSLVTEPPIPQPDATMIAQGPVQRLSTTTGPTIGQTSPETQARLMETPGMIAQGGSGLASGWIANPKSPYWDVTPEGQELLRTKMFASDLSPLDQKKLEGVISYLQQNEVGQAPPYDPYGKSAGAAINLAGGVVGRPIEDVRGSNPLINALANFGGEGVKYAGLMSAGAGLGLSAVASGAGSGAVSGLARELVSDEPFDPANVAMEGILSAGGEAAFLGGRAGLNKLKAARRVKARGGAQPIDTESLIPKPEELQTESLTRIYGGKSELGTPGSTRWGGLTRTNKPKGKIDAVQERKTAEIPLAEQAGGGRGVRQAQQTKPAEIPAEQKTPQEKVKQLTSPAEGIALAKPQGVVAGQATKSAVGGIVDKSADVPSLGGAMGLNKREIAKIREHVKLGGLEKVEEESFVLWSNEAKERGLDKSALETAMTVRKTDRAITPQEHAGMVLKVIQLNDDYDDLISTASKLLEKGQRHAAADAYKHADAIIGQLDLLTTESDRVGTMHARGLSVRRMMAGRKNYQLATVIQESQAIKGGRLSQKVKDQFKVLTDQNTTLEKEVAELRQKYDKMLGDNEKVLAEIEVQRETKKAAIARKSVTAQDKLKTEQAEIKQQLAGLGYRVNDITGVSAEGAYLIGKLAVNYLRQGVEGIEAVTKKILADIPDITERDVWKSLNARNPEAQAKAKSAVEKQIRVVKRQADLLDQIADAQEGIFREPKKWPPTPLEIKVLKQRLEDLKNDPAIKKAEQEIRRIKQIESDIENAKRGIFKEPIKREQLSPTVKKLESELRELKKNDPRKIRDSNNKKIAKLTADIENAKRGVFAPAIKRKPETGRVANLRQIKRAQISLGNIRTAAYESVSEGQRLERAFESINRLQDHLDNQYQLVKKGGTLPAEDVAAFKEEMDVLRKSMRIDKEMEILENQLRTGEFIVKGKPQPKLVPPDLEEKQIKLNIVRKKINNLKADQAKITPARILGEAANTLRTLKATADMSATLRQGLILSITRPELASRAFGKSFKSFFSEYTAEQVDNMIQESPIHWKRVRSKLYLAPLSEGKLSGREEPFMIDWLKKIPYLGEIPKASERHMVTYLNMLRTGVFDDFVMRFPNATRRELEAYANWINITTGRGDLGKAAGVANLMSVFIFAPRFSWSRVQTPYYAVKYAKQFPRLRKEIARDMVGLFAVGNAALVLGKMAGFDVTWDPRTPDFGKIKIGNTRVDLWAGYQQPMRLVARFGEAVTDRAGWTGWGITTKQKEAYDPYDAAIRFAMYKGSPAAAIPHELWTGKTMVGEKVTPTETMTRALLPLFIDDIRDAFEEAGFGRAAMSAGLGFFGVGVNTYKKK